MAVNYSCLESTVTSRLGKDESVSITDRRSHYTEFIYRYCAKSGCSVRRNREPSRIDLYSSAAMSNLRRIRAMFLHGKPRTEYTSGRGLPCKNKAFYSPETQHGRRVIRVYSSETAYSFFPEEAGK